MRKLLFFAIAATTMLTACKKDNVGNNNDPVEVKFTGNVAQIQTRVGGPNGNMWDADDPVGIYMIKADPGTLAPANILSSNRPYTASAGASATFTALGNSPIYYPDDGSNVKFIAYYPYSANIGADYKLPIDVSDQSNQSAIDVLYAPTSALGYNKGANQSVSLQFEHALTKLVFNISNGTNITEPVANGMRVEISGQQTTGVLDLTNGTVTPTGEISTITAEGGSVVEMILLPVMTENLNITFINSAGQRFEVTIPGNTIWNEGFRYSYNVIIDEAIVPTGTATAYIGEITPWNDATPELITGTTAISTMTMVTEANEVTIRLAGSGRAVIEWGDGTKTDIAALTASSTYSHTYTNGLTSHTITITGNKIYDLLCKGNQLTSLDVSKNTMLVGLGCGENQLTELDVSKNIGLMLFDCSDNQLTKLDVSKNRALTLLACRNNKLTEIDVSNTISLQLFYCSGNQLKKLDVSSKRLASLHCWDNQLTELDVSKSIALIELICDNNQLTELDVTGLDKLRYLHCRNNYMEADALDALFHTLNDIPETKSILISNNGPNRDGTGTAGCDRTIAESKGWTVSD